MRRSVVALFLVSFLLFCGCSSARPGQSPSEENETAVPEATAIPGKSQSSLLQESYIIDTSRSLSGIVETAGSLPHHMIEVTKSAELVADDITLDKVDNSPSALSGDALVSGSEAMVFVDNASIALSNSALSGTALFAHALYLNAGSGTMNNTICVTTGSSQSALFLSSSSMDLTDCRLVSTGNGAYCVYLQNSKLTCDMTDISVEDSRDANSFSLQNSAIEFEDCEISGNLLYTGENSIAFYGADLTGDICAGSNEDALEMTLYNCSKIKGCSYDDSAMGLYVSLDKSSSWELTGDSFVACLTTADTSLSNIISNGHSLYYNSENEGNEWLEGKTFSLPGGGFLIPLI